MTQHFKGFVLSQNQQNRWEKTNIQTCYICNPFAHSDCFISKLKFCKGGSFSTAKFSSDIQLSVYSFYVLYLFVRLSLC